METKFIYAKRLRDESINKKLQLIYHDQDVMFDELMDTVKR